MMPLKASMSTKSNLKNNKYVETIFNGLICEEETHRVGF